MLPCVCSVVDHRWRQNVVRTKKWLPCVSLLFLPHWHLLWSITEQTHGNMESIFCFYNKEIFCILFHGTRLILHEFKSYSTKTFLYVNDAYEINHMWTADMKSNAEWSSQLWSQFLRLHKEAWPRYCEVTGSSPVEVLNFFRLLYAIVKIAIITARIILHLTFFYVFVHPGPIKCPKISKLSAI